MVRPEDAAGAKVYELEGFRAVDTTSAGIASSLGFADGERMEPDGNPSGCRRIVAALATPVSVHVEAGHSGCLDGLAETIARVARLVFGPRPMRAVLRFHRAMPRVWLATGTYARLHSGDSRVT